MGTDSPLMTLDDKRRAALTAYDTGCERFGAMFSTGPATHPAIADYIDAIGVGKTEATLAALRSSHESNCTRSHTTDAMPSADDLRSALAVLRNMK